MYIPTLISFLTPKPPLNTATVKVVRDIQYSTRSARKLIYLGLNGYKKWRAGEQVILGIGIGESGGRDDGLHSATLVIQHHHHPSFVNHIPNYTIVQFQRAANFRIHRPFIPKLDVPTSTSHPLIDNRDYNDGQT